MTKERARPSESDRTPSGPQPDRLILPDEDWREAIKRSFKKSRPAEGFPGKQVPAEPDADAPEAPKKPDQR